MSIKIYNSLTRKKEDFKPIKDGEVGIYGCGVTVYDDCHIGHARNAFMLDVIKRYFEFSGYKVTYVRNITDVDDKIINKARKEIADNKQSSDDLRDVTREVAQRYTDSYYEDMGKLGIARADVEPKATEHISEIISIVNTLIDKGFAYVTSNGDVYFDVKKFKPYGKLSGQDIEKMYEGVRIDVDKEKKSPLDFGLWKSSKPEEPAWESPWGDGRPGWHIECSAMSMKYLGENFDIHAGGRDLIFPHHENEIAQSEAATGKPFVNYWIHNGLLTIKSEKMSKSLGNFVSIREVTKLYAPEVLKFFFLGAHYSSPIDFSFEKLEEVASGRDRFMTFFERVNHLKDKYSSEGKPGDDIISQIEMFKRKFAEAMDDNFNTPAALAVLFELLSFANRETDMLEGVEKFDEACVLAAAVGDAIKGLGGVLGIFFEGESPAKKKAVSDAEIEALIDERNLARKNKDFAKADEIRDKLMHMGITIEDHKDGTRWR